MSEVKTEIKAKDGKVTVLQTQQVDAILDLIKRERNEVTSWRPYASGRKDVSIRHVAEVPLIVIEQWMKEGINPYSPDPDMQKKFRQKLNSPEYRYLRTFPGRIRETSR